MPVIYCDMSYEANADIQKEKAAFFAKYPRCPESSPIGVFNLIMRRDMAEQILKGEKKVEFRAYSKHFCDRLFDNRVEQFASQIAEEDFEDYEDFAKPLRVVKTIHFHNYNNTWHLDVECIDNGVVTPCNEDAEMLESLYQDTELKAMTEEMNKKKTRQRPMYFYFALGDIIDTNLK